MEAPSANSASDIQRCRASRRFSERRGKEANEVAILSLTPISSVSFLIKWHQFAAIGRQQTRVPIFVDSLLLSLHRRPALAIQLEQMRGVLLRFGCRTRALKPYAGRSGPSVSRGHGNKFHQIERDIFIAPRAPMCGWTFFHESFS